MEGVEGRDAARRQGANAGAHCAFHQRRGAPRTRGRAAAALCRYRWPRQRHGWHRLWFLAKPARRPRAPFDHVGEAQMPRGGRRHRLEAALALTSASTEWRLSGADLPLLERSTNANDCPLAAVRNTRRDRLRWWEVVIRFPAIDRPRGAYSGQFI